MTPKISYIVATQNRGDLIGDTIKSLINQDEPAWEAIIVDDHGADNTEEVVKNFNDQRLIYIKLSDSHGRGASCARNLAAIWAKAPIVAITDSDDLLYANRTLETLKAFAENPEIDIFYSDFDIWEEKTGIIRSRKTPIGEYSLEKIKQGHFIPHITLALKRQILLDNPYNQFYKIAEDYELLTRLALQDKNFYFCPEKLMKYRISDTNMSIGAEKKELVDLYGKLVRMIRGFIPCEENTLEKIEQLERRK
ncbi:MAG: glycosyltransferase [Candidatus Berkelbacteria bacterium]|nr:glycosyltransferase [Candidatus Berkelbacteria bacterium]